MITYLELYHLHLMVDMIILAAFYIFKIYIILLLCSFIVRSVKIVLNILFINCKVRCASKPFKSINDYTLGFPFTPSNTILT